MSGSTHPFWKPQAIASTLQGQWLLPPSEENRPLFGAAIDTRLLKPGELFFALRGSRTDGHAFLSHARDKGAGLAIIDDPTAAHPAGLPTLLVANARRALGQLAGAWRRELHQACFIAVTGSNGKTTTTRLLYACLSHLPAVYVSPKSYNNDLGVPLTLLAIPPDARCVICEVGANDPGEIAPLSEIIEPNAVLITSIGQAHLQGFGSIETVAIEKASLATHLRPFDAQHPPLLVYPAHEVVLADALHTHASRCRRTFTTPVSHVRFGCMSEASLRLEKIEQHDDAIAFLLDGTPFELACVGRHNACNAAAAIAAARWYGASEQAIAEALKTFSMPEMRMCVQRLGHGIVLINDAYNANPDSMLASLRTLSAMAQRRNHTSRRVAILGDMLELGDAGPEAHTSIARHIVKESLADLVVLIGSLTHLMEPILSQAGIPTRCATALASQVDAAGIAACVDRGDVVLLKASRSMQLERVAHVLEDAQVNPSMQST